MSNGIIDIFSQIQAHSASFIVNTGANFVNLSVPGGFTGRMERPDGRYFFSLIDNFNIISIGCILPLCFEFWDNVDGGGNFIPPIIDMNFLEDGAVAEIQLNPPSIYLPFPSYEMSYGRFVLVPERGVAARYQLNFRFTQTINQRVSMLNVPAALNGMTFYVPIFAKIEHTLELEV